MNNKLNQAEAPPGYVATTINMANKKGDGPIQSCKGCAFSSLLSCTDERGGNGCTKNDRTDGFTVIFVKREPATAKPAPLDTRYTLRLPAAVKAKAQRIGAAAVIAAIEAKEE